MNRTDPDFAAYEDCLAILRKYPEHVGQLHPWTRQQPPRRGDSLANVDRYFRRVSVLRARNRAYIQRLAKFAEYVATGVEPAAAVGRAWLDAPY